MKKWRLINVTSPVVEFEIGGTVFHSEKIKDLKKTPNFANPILERKILVRNISMPLFLTLSPSYFKQQMIGPGIAVALNSYAFFFLFGTDSSKRGHVYSAHQHSGQRPSCVRP